jgi:hypothetical protein
MSIKRSLILLIFLLIVGGAFVGIVDRYIPQPPSAGMLVPAGPPPSTVVAKLTESSGFSRLVSVTDSGLDTGAVALQPGETIRWANNSSQEIIIADSAAPGGVPADADLSRACTDTGCRVVRPGEFWEGPASAKDVVVVGTKAIPVAVAPADTVTAQASAAATPAAGLIKSSGSTSVPTCYVTFSANPVVAGTQVRVSYISTNAAWFRINTVGYMVPGVEGSFTVAPDTSTDYAGVVGDVSGKQYPCLSTPSTLSVTQPAAGDTAASNPSSMQCASCPAGFIQKRGACVCPTGQIEDDNGQCTGGALCPTGFVYDTTARACVGSCPKGTVWYENQCQPGSCIPGLSCGADGNVYFRDLQCARGLSEQCDYGCTNGVCNPPPPPQVVTWKVSPTLIKRGDSTNVSWDVRNVIGCTVTGTNDDLWSTILGTKVSSPITAQTTYTLHCTPLRRAIWTKDLTETVTIVPSFQEQ